MTYPKFKRAVGARGGSIELVSVNFACCKKTIKQIKSKTIILCSDVKRNITLEIGTLKCINIVIRLPKIFL